ncbi:MAG: sel1 repeat family protein [Sphingomonadales bacterium]|nr:sel1 repeat family protein [Sphingomonadales bacterium]
MSQDDAAVSDGFARPQTRSYLGASNLGEMYYNGKGIAQDYAAALVWYRMAADRGDASAQGSLGAMYANGQGVAKDYVQAHKWFNLSGAAAIDAEIRDHATKSGTVFLPR